LRLKALAGGALTAFVCAEIASGTAGASQPHPCRPWHVRTLLTGQGWLESLAFDGRGGITISALAHGRILRLSRAGRLTTLLANVHAPGGEIVRGRYLYFTTGDIVPPAANGTIARLDLKTGKATTWARGLTMPNGLVFLADGDAIVTRDVQGGAPPTDVTRVPAHRRGHPQLNWVRIPDSNGVAVDPSGRSVYVDRTLSKDGVVDRIPIKHPRIVRAVGHLGAGVFPDDMAIDSAGILYVAGFGTGKVYRLDPRTGASCEIASGLGSPTQAALSGAGWPPGTLYVTDAGGRLYQLTPR
jgi:gluconolactonase